jgi:peptidoglycan/LPS O-acetylase OafA/YrhL
LLFDTLGRSISADPDAYAAFDGHYDPLLILGDLANLQGVIVRHYGTNGPLWSVGYEFWFYISFPLLLLPFGRAYSPRTRKIVAALALALCVAVSSRQIWFLFGFAVWGLGAALALAPRPLLRSPWTSLAIVLAANVAMRVIFPETTLREIPATQYLSDAVVALAFANLILSMRFAASFEWRFLDWGLHKRLADFSFTLYAIHNPTIMLLRAFAVTTLGARTFDGAATDVQWLLLVGAMSLTILLAYALSRVTESKLGPARRALSAIVGRVADRGRAHLSAKGSVEPATSPEVETNGPMRTRPLAVRSGA